MGKTWKDMNADERLAARFERLLNPDGVNFKSSEAKEDYRKRITRLIDAIELKKKPDRVPVLMTGQFLSAVLGGASPKQSMYDADALLAAMRNFVTDYDPDYYASPGVSAYGPALELLDLKLYKWPGFNLPEKHGYQCVEREYMKVEDYEALIDDPSDFWMRTYMPRIMPGVKGFESLANFMNLIELPMTSAFLASVGRPEVQEAFEKLLEAGRMSYQWTSKVRTFDKDMIELGKSSFAGGTSKAPYDILADTLRGTNPMMSDIYRHPKLVEKAVEKLTPLAIKMGVSGPNVSGRPLVFMPLHKGADGWMSDEQFRNLYWPSLKAVILALIEEGCVPYLFAEGVFTSRLKYIRELPKGKCLWLFDRTDMAKVKEEIGDMTCIAGNLPSSKIVTGKPEDVREACKVLIDTAGKGGGYIMSMGCATEEGKGENVRAMIDFTKEYGVY